jgi:hypothetical protein
MIQQYHSKGYTQRNVSQDIIKTLAPPWVFLFSCSFSFSISFYCSTVHNSYAMEIAKMPYN